MEADVRTLARAAERQARRIAAQARAAGPVRGGERVLRLLERVRQGVARKGRQLLREHWDLAAFDVVFGSIKAFGVYPALYFAGLVWTVPLMEAALLNTQVWTAGYLVVRGKLRSALGRRRYGHPLDRLDALADRLMRRSPPDARHVHRFTLAGQPRLLRVRHSRVRAWWAGVRGEREPGVVLQSQLRRWVDPEVRFRANPLRANPYLYEAVLLAILLERPDAHVGLLEASAPDGPCTDEERALRATLGETPMLALSRVTEQGDALEAALDGSLGRTAGARCLRWIHAALYRAVRDRLQELEDLRYRVLADRLAGASVRQSPHWRALCCKRAEVRAWVARSGRFARRAARVCGEGEARRLAIRVLAELRSRGLAARRAHLAGRLAGIRFARSPIALPAAGSRA